jgi:adenylate cyclase
MLSLARWSMTHRRRRVEVDLDANGLLEGVHGSARTARELLVRELLADGFTLEELRDAVAKDRIALLPIERLLRSDSRHAPRYRVEQVAELAGVSLEHLRAANAALGLPVAAPGVPALTELDLALARQLAVALAAGLSLETIADVDRTIARGVRKMVAASRTAVIETTLRPGMTEHQAAHALEAAAPLVTNVTSRGRRGCSNRRGPGANPTRVPLDTLCRRPAERRSTSATALHSH